MIRRPMTQRPGVSLTEVLVALFIMALGTLAILTLFPLGAYNMGQALKDDRTAQCAIQADALMRSYWQTNVVEIYQAQSASGTTTLVDPDFAAALFAPNQLNGVTNTSGSPIVTSGGTVTFTVPAATLPTLSTSVAGISSYPVFVDPMGFVAPWGPPSSTADEQTWVAGKNQGLPRRPLSQISTSASIRVCSLMDSLSFGAMSSGIPIPVGQTAVDRDYRYNWLWVIQRPNCQDLFSATMSVVVFDQRPFHFVMNSAETALPAAFQPGSTFVQVSPPSGVVLKKGGWVMDGTISPTTSPPTLHANFYRIVSATDAGGGVTNLELQTPIHRNDGSSSPYTGTLIVLFGVSEVFDRPMLTAQ